MFSVAFGRMEACRGGELVVAVTDNYNEESLQEGAGFDFERQRFEFIREWQSALGILDNCDAVA